MFKWTCRVCVCRKIWVIHMIDFNERIKDWAEISGTFSSIDISKLSCKYGLMWKEQYWLNLIPSNKYLHLVRSLTDNSRKRISIAM